VLSIFVSAVCKSGDFAGVFEHDDGVGYFYLYAISNNSSENRVLGAIRVSAGVVPYAESDISVAWTFDEKFVALKIYGVVWAVFECENGQSYGGNFTSGYQPDLPPHVSNLQYEN
jgi:hypothetical protein